MGQTFRQSMTWLHTWAGVVVGSLLFVIFWMGTLSVFDREIDRWMMPATRLADPPATLSLDRIAVPAAQQLVARGATQWAVTLPTERTPVLLLRWRVGDVSQVHHIDPASGAVLPQAGTLGGTGFIFPFHFRLNLKWMDVGYWLVGLAGMAMLVLIVSGVVIHRKIFREFFTFRPAKRLQRSSLDLHNLSGVLALPFHFLITLSGLVIFINIYFPTAYWASYGQTPAAKAAYALEANGRYVRPKAGTPGSLGSLDRMVAEAESQWSGGRASYVRVWHPGDSASYVEVRRSVAHEVTMNLDQVYFDAASGAVLKRFEAAPVMSVQRFFTGLHFIQFEHWPLRWLYFVAGLAGCLLIATGFMFWLESRRARHIKHGLAGVRVVQALTVGSVTGTILATLAFMVSNRLLPDAATLGSWDRAETEMAVFYAVWVAAFAHAAARPLGAWREQCVAITGMALAAVMLNAVTTGDHVLRTLSQGAWAVAGVDLMLLATAVLAFLTGQRLAHGAQARLPESPTSPKSPALPTLPETPAPARKELA